MQRTVSSSRRHLAQRITTFSGSCFKGPANQLYSQFQTQLSYACAPWWTQTDSGNICSPALTHTAAGIMQHVTSCPQHPLHLSASFPAWASQKWQANGTQAKSEHVQQRECYGLTFHNGKGLPHTHFLFLWAPCLVISWFYLSWLHYWVTSTAPHKARGHPQLLPPRGWLKPGI